MAYQVTFKIVTPAPNWEDKVTKITRTFPQWLCGQRMTRQMFSELVLAEYPDSSVQILDVTTIEW